MTRTAAERCADNVAALRLLKVLEAERRPATDEERAALRLYSGWGDTAVRSRVMDPHGRPLGDLLALDLSRESLAGIARSALNAHYTTPEIAAALWRVADHFGALSALPRAPLVLEPSCGAGVFLDVAPEWVDLRQVVAVELDPLTHGIAAAAYPTARVLRGGFETHDLPEAFDLAIGNVPFGDYPVDDPRLPARCRRLIHDYFVCRCVSLLRPGGVAVLITGKGTMDREDAAARRWIAERADLLLALRMPADAFLANAGTAVTADVLVLRRK